jgi:hypothetical protein
MKKSIRILAVAGAFALVPSFASAFDGRLIECDPTDGVSALVGVKPGLQCAEIVNKLSLSIGAKTANAFDNCNANVETPDPPWAYWELNKYGSKISAANAASITDAELKVKGAAFGSCNLGGSTNGAGAYMTGGFTFTNAIGEKVKGGKGSMIARVGADLPSQSAALNGIVSKGFGAGAVVRALAGLDIGAPENADLLGCNLGAICPPDPMTETATYPIAAIALKTNASSILRIGFPTDAQCTASASPWDCCTGAGAGSCDHDND